MQKLLVTILFISFFSCQSSDDGNTVLPNVPVNETIFLNNPLYSSMSVTPGTFAYAPGGIKGLIIYHTVSDTFIVFDRACPHITPSSCSTMVIEDGINMKCPCDNSKFALELGGAPQSGTPFYARQYKVVKNGNTLIITNF